MHCRYLNSEGDGGTLKTNAKRGSKPVPQTASSSTNVCRNLVQPRRQQCDASWDSCGDFNGSPRGQEDLPNRGGSCLPNGDLTARFPIPVPRNVRRRTSRFPSNVGRSFVLAIGGSSRFPKLGSRKRRLGRPPTMGRRPTLGDRPTASSEEPLCSRRPATMKTRAMWPLLSRLRGNLLRPLVSELFLR